MDPQSGSKPERRLERERPGERKGRRAQLKTTRTEPQNRKRRWTEKVILRPDVWDEGEVDERKNREGPKQPD